MAAQKEIQLGCLALEEYLRTIDEFATYEYPIDFEQTAQVEFLPEGRTEQGKEAGEAVRPLAQPSAEAQKRSRR